MSGVLFFSVMHDCDLARSCVNGTTNVIGGCVARARLRVVIGGRLRHASSSRSIIFNTAYTPTMTNHHIIDTTEQNVIIVVELLQQK